MIQTQLPNKEQWGEHLQLIIKGANIRKADIKEAMGVTYTTLQMILEGRKTYDQLKEAEDVINRILENQKEGK
jgi:predicted transcriptional regulator